MSGLLSNLHFKIIFLTLTIYRSKLMSISSLPTDVLKYIMGFLPTEELVGYAVFHNYGMQAPLVFNTG